MRHQASNPLLAPDFAKAFGISLVVFGHTLRGIISSGVIDNEGIWAEIDRMIYLFHMPLFFYISGLFFENRQTKYGYWDLVKRNIRVLILPIIVWSYLQFSLQYLAGVASNNEMTVFDVVTAPFPPRQQFWFLGALFIITALCGALLALPKQGKEWTAVLAGLCAVSLIFAGYEIIYNILVSNPFASLAAQVVIHIPYFVLGLFAGTHTLSQFKINNIICVLTFTGALTAYQIFPYDNEAIRLVTSVVAILSIYKFMMNCEAGIKNRSGKATRWIIFIGMNSIIIYLAHVILAASYRAVLIKLNVWDVSLHLIGGTIIGLFGPLYGVPIGVYLKEYSLWISDAFVPARISRK